MARAYDPFRAVLDALRADLRDGALTPGSPIVVVDLAKAFRVSPTPVREALSRLAGEGLVEEHRGRGFNALRLDAADLGSLYQLHGVCVAAALTWRRSVDTPKGKPSEPESGQADFRQAGHRLRTLAETLWRDVVEAADNRFLQRQQQLISDQLAVARLVEPQIFPDLASELTGLADLAESGDLTGLKTAAVDYHHRRVEISNRLAHGIRDTFRI